MDNKMDDYVNAEYLSFHDWKILGYVDLACCVIILISNALVVLVLTRKKKTSPMDIIFIHMVIAESLTAFSYVPHALQQLIRATLCSIPEHRTYVWEQISLHSYAAAFIFRTIAVWLAVLLAVWRYIAVSHPLKVQIWCNMKKTRILIIAGYIISLVIAIPPYLSIAVGKSDKLLDENGCLTTNSSIDKKTTIYEFQVPLEKYEFWYAVLLLSYAIFLKMVPSIIFTFISFRLICRISEVKKCNEEMSLNSNHFFRTTIILIVILILFVIAEVPHGIWALLSGLIGPTFFWKYYIYAMEICNSATQISTSFNFIIYYTISDHFRQTFEELFKPKHNRTTFDNTTPAQRYVYFSSTADKTFGVEYQSSHSQINHGTKY